MEMILRRELRRTSQGNHFVRRRLLLHNGFWILSEMNAPLKIVQVQAYVMTYSTRFIRVFSCESATGAVRPCTARARPRMNDLRTIVDVRMRS